MQEWKNYYYNRSKSAVAPFLSTIVYFWLASALQSTGSPSSSPMHVLSVWIVAAIMPRHRSFAFIRNWWSIAIFSWSPSCTGSYEGAQTGRCLTPPPLTWILINYWPANWPWRVVRETTSTPLFDPPSLVRMNAIWLNFIYRNCVIAFSYPAGFSAWPF